MQVIRGNEEKIPIAAALAMKLWPEHTFSEMEETAKEYILGKERAAFLAEENGRAVGICFCSLRHDYVEGTECGPVGYLEGIHVEEDVRQQGVGRMLLKKAEEWAGERGCTSLASDCELENRESLAFHLACGFDEANRIICFVKHI